MKIKPFIAVGLTAVFLSGCGSDGRKTPAHREFFAMDTYMSMTAYGENAASALEIAEQEIHRLESLLSVTDPDSDISCINNSCGSPVEVSDETAEIIKAGLRFGKLTGGKLDITIYPVLKAWGFTVNERPQDVPDDEMLSELLMNVGYENVQLSGNTVVMPPEYMLDLGSLAKGYAADRIMALFRENGVDSAIVSLGGNVMTLGGKPDGKPWKVAVRSPFDDGCIGELEIGEKSVVTSGSYERFFIGSDGRKYHHIIDPETGFPAENDLASVTIVADSSLLCDGLSTALFVADMEKAVEFWESRDDFNMILIDDEGIVYCTDGICDDFRPEKINEMQVIRRE